MAAMRQLSAAGAAEARRKTLCDITNLWRPVPGKEEGPQPQFLASIGLFLFQWDWVSRCVQVSILTRFGLVGVWSKFIELSGAELQKLRLANWQLAQANSQMLALKSLQHELACSRAALKTKSSESEGEADDKIIAVCADDPEYKHYNDIKELPPHRLAEIRCFFED